MDPVPDQAPGGPQPQNPASQPPPESAPAPVSAQLPAADEGSFGDLLMKTLAASDMPSGSVVPAGQTLPPPVAPPLPTAPKPAVEPAAPIPKPDEPPAPDAGGVPDRLDSLLDKVEKGMPVAAGTAFRVLRNELKEVQSAAKTASEKQVEVPPGMKEEIETLRSQVQNQENELAVTRVEATREYRERISEPLKQTFDAIIGLATKYRVEPKDLQAALNDPDPAGRTDRLADLSTDFNRLDLVKFDRLVDDFGRLEEMKKGVAANARQRYDEILKERERQNEGMRSQFSNEWKGSVAKVFRRMEAEMPLFSKSDQAGEWGRQVDGIRQFVERVNLPEMPVDEQVTMAFKAQVFPMALKVIRDLAEQNEQFKERVARQQAAKPNAGAGAAPAAVPAEVSADMTFEEAMARALPTSGMSGT